LSGVGASVAALLQQALALHRQGRLAEAQAQYQAILQLQPGHFDSLHLLGVMAQQAGQPEQGLRLIDRALRVQPDVAAAHNNRGLALVDLRRPDEALASFEHALRLQPAYADAHCNRANLLRSLGRRDEALLEYDRALQLQPDHADAAYNRGQLLTDLLRFDDALASYEQALSLRPDWVLAWHSRGHALRALRRLPEALASYDRALALDAGHAEAHNSRGAALLDLKRVPEALASFERALHLRPVYAQAWVLRGVALQALHRLDEAVVAYGRALALEPQLPALRGTWLNTRMRLCDWHDLPAQLQALVRDLADGKNIVPPFCALALLDDPGLHRIAARVHARARHPPTSSLGPFVRRVPDERIRVGYYSANFHHHAMICLIPEMLEAHDRGRFELHAFSFGPDRRDAMRQRVVRAMDQFTDVRAFSDRDVARLSRQAGIDIAVDLMGYTNDARPGILAEGCAPVQVSYLGFPGTLAVEHMHYLVADRTLIPEDQQALYAEKIVYMPHSYMANDSGRTIADRRFSREELGLPETGFVYCCFNNPYKILPATFDGWMRILQAVPGSVLWLLHDHPLTARNLVREAEARGVDGRRLVFANRMRTDEHLARHRAADLFLDTLPYNAHTTASDALWAGLPLLTCPGRSFAARVSASLLTTLGLPELVASSQVDYEARAIAFGLQPQLLEALRGALQGKRLQSPLFDGRQFARHLETAFEAMLARHHAGLPPAAMEVLP
jgi:predicted O-linked N-acetylglucosamine transferase (SPINDLY family)